VGAVEQTPVGLTLSDPECGRTPLYSAEERGHCCTLLLYWLAPSELSAQIVRLIGRPGPASGDRTECAAGESSSPTRSSRVARSTGCVGIDVWKTD
jgi:hypothetical protein